MTVNILNESDSLHTVKWIHVFLSYTINSICLHPVKWLQVWPFNTNNSIQHYSFISSHLNESKFCNVSLTIQLNICQLFIHS